jgi:hypothetical protein
MQLPEEDRNWLTNWLTGTIAQSDERTAHLLRQGEERTAKVIAAEIGGVHSQIQDLDQRLGNQIQEMDRRIRRIDTNSLTAVEMITRQSRWHEQSDNAIADTVARHNEFARALQEIRTRLDKLEKAS